MNKLTCLFGYHDWTKRINDRPQCSICKRINLGPCTCEIISVFKDYIIVKDDTKWRHKYNNDNFNMYGTIDNRGEWLWIIKDKDKKFIKKYEKKIN